MTALVSIAIGFVLGVVNCRAWTDGLAAHRAEVQRRRLKHARRREQTRELAEVRHG